MHVKQLPVTADQLKVYTGGTTSYAGLLKAIMLIFVLVAGQYAIAQTGAPADSLKADSLGPHSRKINPPHEDLKKQYDFSQLVAALLHPHRKGAYQHSASGITVVPNIAANPTIGFQGGIKAVAGRRLGTDSTTLLSVGATSASITTKGIIYFYINHNIFTSHNKWNLQGNLVVSKSVSPDYGLGIRHDSVSKMPLQTLLSDPAHKVFPIHSLYFNFREKIYKQVAPHLFAGAGVSFEIRRSITNKDTSNNGTPSSIYNNLFGFPQNKYSANGFLFNIEYITRDNPNRAYKGIYADVGIRANATFIGSTKNATQLTTDFRKYVSLSQQHPELVIAFWNWGSYLLGGAIPYLELPGTARDGTFRSGRGYTTQYFKSTKFNDTEMEFRFPILANKFISGVVFGNLQSSNDLQGTQLFEVFQPGYGAGLRILFNKVTRTNLALDYAFGRFGNKGFFLNLNEAF